MITIKNITFSIALIIGAISFCGAQDLVYTPKNPAFGGNYLNYSWLLNSANAQNTFVQETTTEDPLSDFQNSFNDQLLRDVSRQLLNNGDVFGENGITPGTFEFGNLLLEVVAGLNGLIITINDINTGSQTQITVPYD